MKDAKKYVLIFIILALISIAVPIIMNACLMIVYHGDVPNTVRGLSQLVYPITMIIQNIGAAIWLWYLAKKDGSGTFLWPLFGLVGGLLSIGVYYLIRLNEKKT